MSGETFIVYMIRRINWMPRMGQEIEYIVASPSALQELLGVTEKAAKGITHLRGIEVVLYPNDKAHFLVKLKDRNVHEDWLAEYREEPSPTGERWREISFRYRQYQAEGEPV